MVQRIAYGDLDEQFGELRLPPGHEQRPLVVLIHGGYWRDQYRLDLMDPLAGDLFDRGYASWNIEYRRVGPTGGGYLTTTADVAAAIDLVSAESSQSLCVIGHSAGGHLALWNASRPDVSAALALTVGLAPVADLVLANREGSGADATSNFLGGDAEAAPDAYAHAQPDPAAFTGRVVLVHGTADENVPVHQSTNLHDHVARVEVLDDVDHFNVIDPAHHSWHVTLDELATL